MILAKGREAKIITIDHFSACLRHNNEKTAGTIQLINYPTELGAKAALEKKSYKIKVIS